MNESEKMLVQALGKIADMDKNLKEKLIEEELANISFQHTIAFFNITPPWKRS